MPDSATKVPQNRIHLFDPVSLINDGHGGYQASNNSVQPWRVAQSYDDFPEGNTNGALRSYDSFTDADGGRLRSSDSFGMEGKSGGRTTYDRSDHNNDNSSDPRVDPIEVGFREIPMYTAVTTANGTYDHGVKPNGVLRFGVDLKAEDEYDVNPRLWKPSSPTSPKARGSPLNPTRPRSVNSSPLHPSSPTAMVSPLNPSSPRSVPSSPLRPSSTRGSPLNPASPYPINSSPLNPTSPEFVNSSTLHPTSPKRLGSPLHPNQLHHRPMSPNSRTQAIARGRKELMEMVRDLPETFYELSLKDIVERKAEMEVQKETDPPEEKKLATEATRQEEEKEKKGSQKVKKSDSKKKMVRRNSVHDGKFLLKTSVFPMLLGSKKSKKSLGASGSFKIAPVPKPQPTSTRSMKGPEKEWWRRRSCISSESDESNGLSSSSTSSGSSRGSSRSNSNSSNGRRSSRFLSICCFFNGRNLRRIKDKK